MGNWYENIGVNIVSWVGQKYNSVAMPPCDAYITRPFLLLWENRAYKTYEVQNKRSYEYDTCVIFPRRLIRDMFIKRMRRALKDGDSDLFGPDGQWWNREETITDAERIADEIGNDVLFTFSWRDENDRFQEKVGLISLQHVADTNGKVIFQALREAKLHFKKA